MGRFVAGFATASVLWGAAFFVFQPSPVVTSEGTANDAGIAVAEDAGDGEGSRRRRRRGRGRAGRGDQAAGDLDRIAETGDDLGEDDPRNLDLEAGGGEQQLSSGQIDTAMDAAFPRIRRCLVLAAGDSPVTGRLTIGMRIAGDGRVQRVNLRGPVAVTGGESGSCLEQAVRGIQFPSFDGPEMVAHYPITLD